MRSTLILILLSLSFLSSRGQGLKDSLERFNRKRTRISRIGMSVLGGWGAANFLGGGTAYFLSHGEARYFHQMNALWNIANLSIAIPGYLGSKEPGSDMGPIATLKAQAGHERVFLFNGGLDVGYIMGGLYLRELSQRFPERKARLMGYGNSIILQGGFLFLFDAVMYGLHKHHANEKLEPILDQVDIGLSGMRIKIPLSEDPRAQIQDPK